MLLTHALALSANYFFYARKSPYEYVHSVRTELAKLMILVGTRITYQATGDAGLRNFVKHENRCFYSINSIYLSDIGARCILIFHPVYW